MLKENPQPHLSEPMFDAMIHKKKKKPVRLSEPVYQRIVSENSTEYEPTSPEPITNRKQTDLKIVQDDGGYKCPIDGCEKNFRRENLTQMHVKHYHAQYTKYLDSTPNVADLAYARTAGESLERSPVFRPKVATPRNLSVPECQFEASMEDPEIVKILNPLSKSTDSSSASDTDSDCPTNDISLKSLRSHPSSLKTLIPIKNLTPIEPSGRKDVKRKRLVPERNSEEPIIESEVLKILQMKSEELIKCMCGVSEEDGLMIQCELCLCWQHAYCINIRKNVEVPDKYICFFCRHPVRPRSSKKCWVKYGALPTGSYHCKDEEDQARRLDKLKKSHDISGGLAELKDFMHSLKLKIKIAEEENHPELCLWSKPWLPEEPKADQPEDTASGPQPEAADCRLNLLEHITHCEDLIEERLNDYEKQIDELDSTLFINNDENYIRVRDTTSMLLRDLNTLKELSEL